MDFGRSGNEFWHTWWPRGPEELNSPAFKKELQEVVDTLREDVLKSRFAMERFCYEHGGKIDGGWTQNYGYIVETEHYRYCLRCNPSPGDYNGYLTCFNLNVQRQNMARDKPLVGRVTYANGDAQEFTDAEAFLECVREELPYRPTTGFRYEVLTDDPTARKAVDDVVFAAIRSYFADEQVIRSIAGYAGMDFDTLIGGDYKLVVEPLAYLCYNGQQFAMTATEAALYDQIVNGDLRKKLGTLTHKNLPLAIFLEEADLGYTAWSGSRTEKASNGDIISSLGIGIVRFNETTTPPEINDFDYEYRVNTEVITSVEVRGGQSDPDNPVSVRFNIQGRTYTVSNVYYPDGDSQLAWVRWRTPAEPCVITISVSVYGGGSAQGTITCNIVDLDGNDPPNPLADDRNDAFRLSSIPEKEQVTSASWGIWSPWWQENWEWVENWQKCWHTDRWTDADGKTHRDRWYHWVDNGWWEDHGWWEDKV